MKRKVKRNILLIVSGIFSMIGIIISRNSLIMRKNILGDFIWIYLLIAFLSWLNIFSVQNKKIYVIDYIMQLSILGIKRGSDFWFIKNQWANLVSEIVIIMLILTELFFHIWITDETSTENKNEVQEKQMADYLQGILLGIFGIKNEKLCIDKKQEFNIRILVHNALAFLTIIICYFFKFILDIINIKNDKYIFPEIIVSVYIACFTLFFLFEFKKNRLLGYSILKSMFIIVSCQIGIYLFVFRQYGTINVWVILCTVYLIAPFFLNLKKVIETYTV